MTITAAPPPLLTGVGPGRAIPPGRRAGTDAGRAFAAQYPTTLDLTAGAVHAARTAEVSDGWFTDGFVDGMFDALERRLQLGPAPLSRGEAATFRDVLERLVAEALDHAHRAGCFPWRSDTGPSATDVEAAMLRC